MPIPFSSIPEHLQLSVVKKVQFSDFIKFSKSSRKTFEIAKRNKNHLSHVVGVLYMGYKDKSLSFYYYKMYPCSTCIQVENLNLVEIPVRFVAACLLISIELTETVCNNAVDIIRATKLSAKLVQFRQKITCSPKSFNHFIDALQVKHLNIEHLMSPDFLLQTAMKNIQYINVNCSLHDDDLSALKVPKLYLSSANITSLGVNAMIKEWLKGERTILNCQLSTRNQLQKHIIFDGISVCPISNLGNRVFITNDNNEKICVSMSKFEVHMNLCVTSDL